ncbi:MAG: hypothetical protein HY904_19520 [Deltaproteobacteria bacterium]|nr:hypothetical protein [Deltaproteobacteria bacterium]
MLRRALPVLLLLASAPALAISEVRVSAQETNRPNTFALEASATIEASALAARHAILRQCQDKNMSRSLQYCRMFRKDGNRTWNYSISKYPLLSPRDVVLERVIPTDLDEAGTGTFRMEWKLTQEPGLGVRAGHVRPPVYEGFWIVEALPGGKRSRATYRAALNPGGYIPVFVMQWATRHGIPATLEKLEEVAQEKEKQGKLMIPVKDDPWAGLEILPLENTITGEMKK